MNISYDTHIIPYLHKFTKIKIEEEKVKKVENFIEKLIKVKSIENHHIVDNGQEFKRWNTGLCGEAAIEKLLNINIIDYNIGNSSKFHISDLSNYGVDIGIKTVEFGKFPIIFKHNLKSEIIVLKESRYDFIVCGVATKSILNKYQSESLIISPNLRNRGTKTGFYGFEYLVPIGNTLLDTINNIKSAPPIQLTIF